MLVSVEAYFLFEGGDRDVGNERWGEEGDEEALSTPARVDLTIRRSAR